MASARQMFINWMLAKGHKISPLIRTPEQYKDWNQFEGHHNLIDFERDAGNLCQAIVLFSESAGSYAELGAFCMDDVLADRLFVVIEKQHYSADSFIANGPIRKIESLHENSICVADSIAPNEIEPQLADIAWALDEKIRSAPKTTGFDPDRARDQFLLVADLVELFGAITHHELMQLIEHFNVKINQRRFDQIVNQLRRFELAEHIEKTTKRFLIAPSTRHWFLDYEAKKDQPAFDRQRFKLKHSFPWVQNEPMRLKAYKEIHSKA